MIKAFAASVFGIFLTASLGLAAAGYAMNSNINAEDSLTIHKAEAAL